MTDPFSGLVKKRGACPAERVGEDSLCDCKSDEDCAPEDPDPCLRYLCDEDQDRCVEAPLDLEEDVCGDSCTGGTEDCESSAECPAPGAVCVDCECTGGIECKSAEDCKDVTVPTCQVAAFDKCGDGTCDEAAPQLESPLTCPEDCGCQAVVKEAGIPECAGYTAPSGCYCNGPPWSGGNCADSCISCGAPFCFGCGDGSCYPWTGESSASCPAECAPPACDGVCQSGETASSCLEAGLDVHECPPWICGDWKCNVNETAESCPEDCLQALFGPERFPN